MFCTCHPSGVSKILSSVYLAQKSIMSETSWSLVPERSMPAFRHIAERRELSTSERSSSA